MYSSDALLKYALCYSMMFILTGISKQNKSNRLFDTKGIPAANARKLIGLHVAGIIWLGLVPVTLFKQSFKAILSGSGSPNFSWLLLFVFLLAIIIRTGFRAGRQIHINHENTNASSNKFLNYYFPVRILFLCTYELFFRGLLLFDCIKWFGILSAVILTTGLTVLIHVFTNKKEMWACIPFGILVCTCCIAIQAVWPAIVLHLALSMSYEIPPVNQFLTQLKSIK